VTSRVGTLRRELLRQTIQDKVKEFIIVHGYQPGDVLPAEADLAHELGISRPSLREAIRVLQTLGVVESRHGAGTFVGRFSLTPLVDGLAFSIRVNNQNGGVQAVEELLQIREILERDLIATVTPTLPVETLVALDAIVGEMETRATREEEFTEQDRAFHRLLYRELGNPLIVQLIQAFWDVFNRLRDELPGVTSELHNTAADHRRIVAALKRHDGAAASAAMSAHFSGLRRRIAHTQSATEP
jgi:DNA-binding FadR family transcriptional regulator